MVILARNEMVTNGGELYICTKGMVPQQNADTKDKHFTVLGITTLLGKIVRRVLFFLGKGGKKLYETEIDVFAEAEAEVSNAHFFEMNSGSQ